MSDFDDLFDKNDVKEQDGNYNKQMDLNSRNDDFYRRADEDKRNGMLLALYIVVSLLVTFLSGVLINSEYGYLKDALEVIEETVEVNFAVSDNINTTTNQVDENYPFKIDINGEFTNRYLQPIPVIIVTVDFFGDDGELIGSQSFSGEDILVNESFIIDDELISSVEPITISVLVSANAPSMLFTIISLFQVTITAVIFFVVDKMNFKKDWEDFKRNRRTRVSSIFTGFLLVYASLIIANLILTALGVQGTSENEMVIQSLFSADPLNLFLLFMLLCVLTPIVEEVIFRKVIFNLIEPRSNHIVAIIATGAIFGIMHVISFGDFVQAIPYVTMGLVFGYIYWKSNKNIYVVIAVHFLNNFLSWLIYVLMIYGVNF